MKELQASLQEVRPGRKLFVRRTRLGGGDKPSSTQQMLCIHGLCATEQQFLPLLSRLQADIDCWSYDWMGCGQSPILRDREAFSKRETVLDLLAVMELLDPKLPTLIVAHSYGPSILVEAFELKPNLKIVGCVLIGTSLRIPGLPPCQPDGGLWIMKLPVFLLNCLQSTLTESFIQLAIHPSHEDLREMVRQASNDNDMFLAQSYHGSTQWSHAAQVPPHLPILILHGAEDGLIPVAYAQALANALDAPLEVIDTASHMVFLEQVDVVAQHVQDFLRKLV